MMNYLITKKFISFSCLVIIIFMNFIFCNYFFIITNSYGFRRYLVRFMVNYIITIILFPLYNKISIWILDELHNNSTSNGYLIY